MKPLPISAVAGLGGLIALAALLPRFDPSRSAPLILDRGQAIERVRHFADELRHRVKRRCWRGGFSLPAVVTGSASALPGPTRPKPPPTRGTGLGFSRYHGNPRT